MNAQRWILVPLDGSARAEAVLPQATAMARATGCGLLLLQVVTPDVAVEPLIWPFGMPMAPVNATMLQAREPARDYLHAVARRLEPAGVAVRAEVMLDTSVVGALLERIAEDPSVAMVAITTHGRSGVPRLVFGSVAERVLHAAPVPLLVLRTNSAAPGDERAVAFRRIVVPLDGSSFAEQALVEARAIAQASGATLVLTTVVGEVDDVSLAAGGIEPYWMLAEAQAEIDRRRGALMGYLESIADRLSAEGLSVWLEVAQGDAPRQILRTADEQQADLVVMATHGRGGLPRFVFGSVATEVLRRSHTPLLLVHAYERPRRSRTDDSTLIEKRRGR